MAHRLLSVGWSLSEPSKCMACGLSYHSMLLPNFGLMVNKWLCRLWKKSALLDSWRGLAVSLVSFCFESRRFECIAFASRVYRPFTFDCRYCYGWFFLEKPKRCLFVYHEMYLEVNAMGGMYSHKQMSRALHFDPWRENWRFRAQLYKQDICTLLFFSSNNIA